MSHNFLRAIFSRRATGQTTDPIVAIGGQNASGSYVGMAFDASGNINVTVASGGGGGTAVNVVQWGSSSVQSASFGVPTVGWFQRLDATNDAVLAYAQARTTDPAVATNASNTPVISDSLGKLVVLPGSVNDLHLDGQTQIAQVAATPLINTVGAGIKIALQSILATGSGSQINQVVISGGPNIRTFGFVPVTGFFAHNAGASPLYITSASSALFVACGVTSTINVFVTGYKMSN